MHLVFLFGNFLIRKGWNTFRDTSEKEKAGIQEPVIIKLKNNEHFRFSKELREWQMLLM